MIEGASRVEFAGGFSERDMEIAQRRRVLYEERKRSPVYCECGTRITYMAGKNTKRCMRCQDKEPLGRRCSLVRRGYLGRDA